jgi:hypothetical protein
MSKEAFDALYEDLDGALQEQLKQVTKSRYCGKLRHRVYSGCLI